jgi:hypothetical protein
MPTDPPKSKSRTVWLIQCTGYNPPVFIADPGGLTYRAHKAKQYKSREEAEAVLEQLHLAATWEVVARGLIPHAES